MSNLPIHPLVVHLPMALAAVVPLVALGVLVAWWRGWLSRRAWWIAAALQAALVAGAVVALETGEAEEEVAERAVAEAPIEAHEEAAERFTWLAGATLLLFAVAGAVRRPRPARAVAAIALAGSIATLGLGVQVGHAGAELTFRHGAARAYQSGAATVAVDRGDDDD